MQIVFCRSVLLLNYALYLSWNDQKNPFGSERYGIVQSLSLLFSDNPRRLQCSSVLKDHHGYYSELSSNDSARRKMILLMRGVLGFLAISTVYAAVSMMPLADAAVLMYLAPCFVAVLAPSFLKQPANKASYISIPVAFVGLLLVTQPPMIFGIASGSSVFSWGNLGIGLSQAMVGAGVKLVIGYLGTTESTAHIMFSMAFVSIVGSAVFMISSLSWQWPQTFVELFLLLSIGLCACIHQFCATEALKRSQASLVMSISYLGVVWSLLYDAWIFSHVPNRLSLSGAILIILANLFMIVYDWKQK